MYNTKRHRVISDIVYNVGDVVKCPFDEIGEIVHINNEYLDWFKYKVKITNNTMNDIDDILEFKFEQLGFINH